MKLYLVHVGFYDDNISSGFYESHTNYFVVADNIKSAKSKARSIKEFKDKKMHIDGIKDLSYVDGYKVSLEEGENSKEEKILGYDESKKL